MSKMQSNESNTRFALISVSDKTGVVDLGRGLVAAGFTILSTGGTARALLEGGVEVRKVSDYTGHPEIMNGRVKTLHPKVHGGILGLRDVHAEEAGMHAIDWIDMVVVNLYPFESTIAGQGVSVADAVEQIDIGGPTMVRAAAKNHRFVTVVTDPADYSRVLDTMGDAENAATLRAELAIKAFQHTSAYDGVIARWLSDAKGEASFPQETGMPVQQVQTLRYGENPHQSAAFYSDRATDADQSGTPARSLARIIQRQGKHLSFNNLADLDATLRVAFEFDEPACVVVKHMNPCGAAVHPSGVEAAFTLALSADPVSAYGGIVAFNQPVDADTVRALRRSRTFFEILAAPGFSEEALELLAPREKLRVMELPEDWGRGRPLGTDAKRVMGGWLLQDWDLGAEIAWSVPSERAPTEAEAGCLRFAWAVCRNVKSNAIVLARPHEGGFVLNGIGAGQMSRVDSVRLAISKATRDVPGSVLASDAFFPFPDGVQVAVDAGVSSFIQPGGSIRDDQVIGVVDDAQACMVMTGVRHFRH